MKKVIEDVPIYDLDELIDKCEAIFREEERRLNFPLAFLTLAQEIKKCRKAIRTQVNTVNTPSAKAEGFSLSGPTTRSHTQ